MNPSSFFFLLNPGCSGHIPYSYLSGKTITSCSINTNSLAVAEGVPVGGLPGEVSSLWTDQVALTYDGSL